MAVLLPHQYALSFVARRRMSSAACRLRGFFLLMSVAVCPCRPLRPSRRGLRIRHRRAGRELAGRLGRWQRRQGQVPGLVKGDRLAILIVDDEPDTRRLLAYILNNAGHSNIQMAISAHDALEQLGLEGTGTPGEPPDLILMDLTLPDMHGVEAIRRIKAAPAYEDVPIVVVTGRTEDDELVRAFDAGAVDYIRKPFNRIEFMARVRSALQLKSERDKRKAREGELVAVTEQLETANQQLERLSWLDGLTDIPNRRQFDATLDLEWRRCLRHGLPLALIMTDVDHFKSYNDHLGHQAGDDCLRRVARAHAAIVSRPGDLAARYGGEEFALILPDTDLNGAEAVAQRLRASVEELRLPHPASSVGPTVTISAGVASIIPATVGVAADLIAAADRALYQAKQTGRNRVHLASDGPAL